MRFAFLHYLVAQISISSLLEARLTENGTQDKERQRPIKRIEVNQVAFESAPKRAKIDDEIGGGLPLAANQEVRRFATRVGLRCLSLD